MGLYGQAKMTRFIAQMSLATLFIVTGRCISASEPQASAITPAVVPTANVRNLLFNDDWRFSLSDDANASNPSFDDRKWRKSNLPHDWSVEGSFDPKLASCTAFLPCGIGWYRKTFPVPADAKGKVISVRFDGISNHSTIWCNGRQVGERPYGYSSFTCDLTPAIQFGDKNLIAVRVDHRKYADSRWYAGSGIYRNVFLNITDKVHFDTSGTFVTTPKASVESADVNVKSLVKNELSEVANVMVVTQIIDAIGKVVAAKEQSGSVAPAGEREFSVDEIIDQPALWSPDHPDLYRVHTELKLDGAVVDDCTTHFGVRTIAFDPQNGFLLNGHGMKLKGVCLHHDAGALGAAVPIKVWKIRLMLLKEVGCNAIRCSHNPPAPEFLDLCDRIGFLLMDEAFDEWTGGKKKWVIGHNVGEPGTDGYHSDFEKWADIDIRDMVLRDRNHPCVIMWSIGNEIDYNNDPFPPNSPELPPIAERLIKDVKAVDTTRPVTAACAFPATNLFKKLLDIEGYNYMEQLYPGDHAANPTRVIYGSENFHSFAAWQAVAQNDFIAGQFLWTGIDYLGEAGVWPSHANGAGLLNLAGFPKNQYYFRKSLWTDAPMVYLSTRGAGGGRRQGRLAIEPTIYCFTNCDRVELFHDGQSLGSKSHAPGEVLTWQFNLTSGVLKAIGKKGAAEAAFELRKAEGPSQIALTSDVTALKSDGQDVAQIEVEVTDKHGTLVPDASNLVECIISGPGRILGIENADLQSTEDYKATSRHVYQGRMRIYVQSRQSWRQNQSRRVGGGAQGSEHSD